MKKTKRQLKILPKLSLSELIQENLSTKNPFLNLLHQHHIYLKGDEPELDLLINAKHLRKIYIKLNFSQQVIFPFIQSLENLEELRLWQGQITDASSLKHLKKLKTLSLIFNQIEDISFIDTLNNLEAFNIASNQVENVNLTTHLKKLNKLCLSRNYIKDISFLNQILNVEELLLSHNQIENIEILKNLTQLKVLEISNNPIQDITPLKFLKNLQKLSINYDLFKSIPNWKHFSHLKELKITTQENDYPPIWYIYFYLKKEGSLGDYLHLQEPPFTEKIYYLLKTTDEKNMKLAEQLAKGQGWSEDMFEMYYNYTTKRSRENVNTITFSI